MCDGNKQRFLPAIITCVRNISADTTDLKAILADKVPKEQERVKNFRKAHGATKVGEVTVDMVSSDKSIQGYSPLNASYHFNLI